MNGKGVFKCIALLLCIAVFTACGVSKEGRGFKKLIDGKWTLKTVVIEGNNSIINAKVFNEADNNCFIGSSWNFIANNSMGSYTLQPGTGACTGTIRNFRWSIYEPKGEEKKFQFKRLDEKNNPMDDNNGFRLTIGVLTESNMQLTSVISYEGRPVSIVYNFVK